jgi:hypothetical protein
MTDLDRRQPCQCGVTDHGADGYPICMECFKRKPVMAPWRRRSIEQAGGDRFAAVHDVTGAV